MPFPDDGLVYDYRLDDGGASKTKEDEDEEETKKTKVEGLRMSTHTLSYSYSVRSRYNQICESTYAQTCAVLPQMY